MVLNHKTLDIFCDISIFMIINSIKTTPYLDLNDLTLTCAFL